MGERGHTCPVPDIRIKLSTLSPLIMMSDADVLKIKFIKVTLVILYKLRRFPLLLVY